MAIYVRESDGSPVLAESFVLFLDVLGASEMASADDVEQQLKVLDSAIAEGRKRTTDQLDDPWFLASWFSDNLALASPIRSGYGRGEPELATFLHVAGTVQLHLALDGVFTRGGLALGKHFMDDNISFGPGLVEAVELERQATYPRILLSDSVVDLVQEHLTFYGDFPMRAPQNRDLWVDDHGSVFVNYLDAIGNYVGEEMREAAELVEQHRDQVAANLNRHRGDPHVWAKYQWLASYHNAFCAEHGLDEFIVDARLTSLTFRGIGAP
jgi:hypothetical protein